ncbi:hypothetical protein [Streptomyces zaomyceticus]|uniref:hypothetical protein n=1 Tax=Streptomyces zaomyceticus TaxID=68286 RepID=UPI0037B9E96C
MVELPEAETSEFGEIFHALAELRKESAHGIAVADYGAVQKLEEEVTPWLRGFEGAARRLPIIALASGVLADFGVAYLADGNLQKAKECLTLAEAHIGSSVEMLANGASVVPCEHGRMSLDGECLQIPPCPTS